MITPSKAINANITIVITIILLTFILPILLLTKTIPVQPNAALTQQLLFIAIPITLTTLLFQWYFFRRGLNRLRRMKDPDMKRQKLLSLFTIRTGITLVAVIPNFIFLTLTNFDLFLFLNIMMILWMIYLFPFPEKVKLLLE
jgi:fatty acid desaturase